MSGSAEQRVESGDQAALAHAGRDIHAAQQSLQMKMEKQTSEVRMSTQLGLNQADDFADRTGGAPSQEDVADLPYQMRPQMQSSQP